VLKTIAVDSKDYYRDLARQVDYSDARLHEPPEAATLEPFSVTRNTPTEYWNLSLQEAIVLALSNSQVLRDFGGQVLRAPATMGTIHNPTIVESDPRFGLENALSAFDAQFTSRLFYEKNDRALNNTFFGGGTRLFRQDLGVFQNAVTKQSAAGTRFYARHNTEYDANNAPGNIFPSAWTTNIEAEFRHPLLQGSGVEFNRIAGVGTTPGLFNGVVLARINTDISLAEFEGGVRNLLADVENAYWDLYAAYRDLQSKITARDNALEVWRRTYALFVSRKQGGRAADEAYAREQYYRFQDDVEYALSGQVMEATRTGGGSSAGTFRGPPGVQMAERRLRLIIGLPVTDGRMIRPADEPVVTRVTFDWRHTVHEALARRPELRRQRWVVKRREMELSASRNFLLPRLDATGRYRWRGFGDDLINPDGRTNGRFDNAWDDLTSGDFQEWQLGVDLNVPLGFRAAHNAVRNAQMQLARERALLEEQQRTILNDVSNAVADLERAFQATQTGYNRLVAARDHLTAVQLTYQADKAPLDMLLEAQRRFVESEGRYYRTLADFAITMRNVHYEKGTSLDYHDVYLQEDRTRVVGRTGEPAEQGIDYTFETVPAPSAGGTSAGDMPQPPKPETLPPAPSSPQEREPASALPPSSQAAVPSPTAVPDPVSATPASSPPAPASRLNETIPATPETASSASPPVTTVAPTPGVITPPAVVPAPPRPAPKPLLFPPEAGPTGTAP
jgi:outer membrane protein TolC